MYTYPHCLLLSFGVESRQIGEKEPPNLNSKSLYDSLFFLPFSTEEKQQNILIEYLFCWKHFIRCSGRLPNDQNRDWCLQRMYCPVIVSFFSPMGKCLIFVVFPCKMETIAPNLLIWIPVNEWYLDFYWPLWQYLLFMTSFVFSLSFHKVYSWQLLQRISDSSVSQMSSPAVNCLRSTLFVLKKAKSHCSGCCLFYFWLDPDSWITHSLYITFY